MTIDYKRLTAPCGIACFDCPLFEQNTQTPERLALNTRRPQLADMVCRGCRDQNCVLLDAPCPTRQCAEQHGVAFCHECPEFPCRLLAPLADQAATFPHNIKVFNLCRIKSVGIDRWAENESQSIRKDYFHARFQIGAGPQTD